jgi:hypothetical protein
MQLAYTCVLAAVKHASKLYDRGFFSSFQGCSKVYSSGKESAKLAPWFWSCFFKSMKELSRKQLQTLSWPFK